MKRIHSALFLLTMLALLPPAGRADEVARCSSSGDEDVSIACSGVPEVTGNQLAELMSRILSERIDPHMVIVKLGEIEPVPPEGVPRELNKVQEQAILNILAGKPSQQIAIVAHPLVSDSAQYARSVAQPLLTVGWHIEDNQVRRAAPKNLEQVYGVALVVQNAEAPPETATDLRRALSAARIPTPLLTDSALAPQATLLWIGRRPSFK